MGRQSSRLHFQGKDHKDIYFQGHYHDAMYKGCELVWEKLDGKLEPLLYGDITVGVDKNYKETQVSEMISTVFGSVVFRARSHMEFAANGSAYLFYYGGAYSKISGNNTAVRGNGILLPDNGLYQKDVESSIRYSRETFVYAFSGIMYLTLKFSGVGVSPSYVVYTMEMYDMSSGSVISGIQFYIDGVPVQKNIYADAAPIEIGARFSQYFAGEIHADVIAGQTSYGICSSTDGINWKTGSRVTGNGTVIGGILFYSNGSAINQNYEPVTYSKKPAIFVNGWYYAEELENGWLMRSQNLINWERYKDISVSSEYKVSGYWRTQNLLCFKGTNGIYKYKIHL